ncbi:uncharacterized protein UTRI_00315_B [Ustilago trichophora]|uniref:Uncharacterized protein n=1 Tax=Ustilago trichophora TaxID=86804 RepID=A0A5C3DPJ4_9BASI|nr:uncharacterized protein UTRI_00315_B [Ustilago trichophora]
MRIKATLIATATIAILATADLVTGWFVTQVTQDSDLKYDDFCHRFGSHVDMDHVCFKASTNLFKQIKGSSTFKAYLSPKLNRFALVLTTDKIKLDTDTYSMSVTFAVIGGNGPLQRCAEIKFVANGETKPFDHRQVCHPYEMEVTMPDKAPVHSKTIP